MVKTRNKRDTKKVAKESEIENANQKDAVENDDDEHTVVNDSENVKEKLADKDKSVECSSSKKSGDDDGDEKKKKSSEDNKSKNLAINPEDENSDTENVSKSPKKTVECSSSKKVDNEAIDNDEKGEEGEEKKKDENSDDVENVSKIEDEKSKSEDDDKEKKDDEDSKPVGIRLVPLNLLLRQDILTKQDDPKSESSTDKKSTRKSTNRKGKNASLIEISSDESGEQISISSSSSESDKNESASDDDDDDFTAKRTSRASKKNSTNNKLSNGTKSHFKEPMSPNKLIKNTKPVTINLEKMPDNVNKLMKCYRLNDSLKRIDSWSETDDFENMIVTSKIDRTALDKAKNDSSQKETNEMVKKPAKTKRAKIKLSDDDDDDDESDEPKVSKELKRKKKVQENVAIRSRSTRAAANNARKKIIEDSTSSENSSSIEDDDDDDDDDDDIPLKKIISNKNKSDATSKNTRNKKNLTSESEQDKSKKKNMNSEGGGGSESDKNTKKKKRKVQDDHKEGIATRKQQRQESSSDEEEAHTKKSPRSLRSKENSTKKSKHDSSTTLETNKKSSPRIEKTSELKITINLNKNKVINHAKENNLESDSGDSSESNLKNESRKDSIDLDSSESDNDLLINKLKVKKENKKKKADKSDENSSKDDNENDKTESDKEKSSDIEDEIPEEEKVPIFDQKLRTRNKYESNTNFTKLKQKIQERKKKIRHESDDDELETKEKSSRLKNKGKENHSENHANETNGDNDNSEGNSSEKGQKGKFSNKRKRVLSSSEEEEEEDKKVKKEEAPVKKRKERMDEDSDYKNNSNSDSEAEEEKEKGSDSSDDEIRKRKVKRSSDDDDDDLDEIEKERKKEKRRKRIKKAADSDEDGSGDDKKAKGRKTIRKILRNDKLDISTKEAAKIERERKQRIEDRQQMYNQFYDERPEEAKEITQLVLDFDEETKEPLLQVNKKLAKKLKPHQANGVKFMWDACFESLERCENENGSGCILAHCMGLGKTLQVITLVHTLIANSDETNVTRVLVVCPLNTVLNWVNEFNKWLKDVKDSDGVIVYEISKLKQNIDRANKMMEWHNEGGVMIMSYDMFRNLSNDTGNRLRKKIKESLQTSLLDPGPDLVICDEGHLLKNEKTSISKAMMKLRTLRRIVLTGTPLQNNLKEYYCMVQFVKPNLLGKYQEYMNRFVNPITNGQYTDSTEYDIKLMRRRAHVLHNMLNGCVQRRDYSVLAPFLPPKHEYVISIKLTPMQINLYKFYMESKAARQGDDANRKASILFQDFQNLQRIWSAPKALRYNSDRYEIEMQRRKDLESEDESEGSIKDFIDDSDSAVSTSSDDETDDENDDDKSINSDEVAKKKKKKKGKGGVALPRRTRAMAATLPPEVIKEEEEAMQPKYENPTEWWMQICPEEELNNIEHSSKLMLLMSILEKCEAIGDKLLVFSQSLYSLDVIEHFLNYIDEQTQNNVENATFAASWTLGQDYFRLDGSTAIEQRNSACKHFNDPKNPRARLFLISTRAGGLGINLVAANRVVIFDVSWNPSHDLQSIFRVYRFGQTKPCYIYRFLAYGTMEEKIYERQVTKQAISKRVIDEQQIDRHYNQNDLQELYKYDLETDDDIKEIPILPKDRLFAEMLQKYEDMIYKYHEHDTLLENKEEDTLDEEERKQAWEEFEAEKNRPQYVSYLPQQNFQQQQRIGPVTSNNIFGIRTDVLLKLLSMKARLDNQNITEANVKHAIPVLMQELYRQMDRGELTLYQQLLALSSSLEVPTNYGGRFQVNENLMHQAYNSMNTMPTTSAQANSNLLRSLVERQQNLTSQLQNRAQLIAKKQRSPPRIDTNVIEID